MTSLQPACGHLHLELACLVSLLIHMQPLVICRHPRVDELRSVSAWGAIASAWQVLPTAPKVPNTVTLLYLSYASWQQSMVCTCRCFAHHHHLNAAAVACYNSLLCNNYCPVWLTFCVIRSVLCIESKVTIALHQLAARTCQQKVRGPAGD